MNASDMAGSERGKRRGLTLDNRAALMRWAKLCWSAAAGAVLALTVLVSQAQAGQLPEPTEMILLSVTGAIGHSNDKDVANFDRKMLQQLPQTEYVTTTPWTKGKHRYKGVLLRDILTAVDAQGSRIEARALNDYQTVIKGEVIANYDVLVAMEEDGKPLTLRNKGPLWVIFPLSDHPEIDVASTHSQMIWQLRSLNVLP